MGTLLLAAARTEVGAWKWTALPPAWMLTLAAIAFFVFARTLYRLERGRAGRATRLLLAGLRAAVLFLLVLVTGVGGPANGFPMEAGFNITVASEVMAIFCLARNLQDLQERLARIVIGYTRDEHPVTALDLYPTFAGLAGAPLPEGKKVDGIDIWADVLAGRNARKGGMIYALRHHAAFSNVGIRRDQWKLLRVGTADWQLFNLEEDIATVVEI